MMKRRKLSSHIYHRRCEQSVAEVDKKTLIVSGATGWLGRELLEGLTSPIDKVSSDTTLISTKVKTLKLSSGREMLTQTYEDVTLPTAVDGFVNLAFLTKEKVEKVGFDNFVLRNMELISRACRVIETSKPKWVLSVSSGAVFRAGTTEFERDIRQNPYGFLKRVEELLLADSAQKVGSTLIIGRLWGSSGRYMPIHHSYALSDFLSSALDGKPIHIRSGIKVMRRFTDAGEFMQVLFALAQEGQNRTIDSGGELVEVADLATEISKHFPGIAITRATLSDVKIDDYYPRTEDLAFEAKRLGIRLSTMQEQVSKTLEGHRALSV